MGGGKVGFSQGKHPNKGMPKDGRICSWKGYRLDMIGDVYVV